jgi:ABC-2 type transport system ATP-binding protein
LDESIVSVRGLTKRYFRARALDGLDLELRRGTILGLLGVNGAGKSTLLKVLAGLVKPSSGQVTVGGLVPGPKTRAFVAYLPEVDYLYSWMTVRQSIAFVSAFFPDWRPDKAEALLTTLGLDPGQVVGKLSKGMRARLKILMAMAREAQLVLLDEPLSGIDVPSRAKIVRAIVSEFRAESQTIVVSTHEVADTEAIFDDVLLLDHGKVKLMGNVEELRASRGTSLVGLMEEEYA